jgi:hypothetical protein
MFVMFISVVALGDTKSKTEVLYSTTGEPIGIVGYTEHGVPVTKDDIKVRSINTNQIRGWKWDNNKDQLILRMNKGKKIIIEFYGRCWDIDFANQLLFKNTLGSFTFITVGDIITPITFGRYATMPCRIKKIYEMVPA